MVYLKEWNHNIKKNQHHYHTNVSVELHVLKAGNPVISVHAPAYKIGICGVCWSEWLEHAQGLHAYKSFRNLNGFHAETQKRTMHVIFQNYKSQNTWWGRALLMASSRRPNCAANENRYQGGNQSNYEPKRCRTVCGRRKLMLHSSNVAHKQPLNSQHLPPDLAADACLWRCWW